MADRVYPATKPNPYPLQSVAGAGAGAGAGNGGGGGPPSFPATKGQMYGAARPIYRRPLPPPKRRRSCCCACCLWLIFFLVCLVFLAAIASAVVYFIYRPHRPTFTVSSLRLSALNVTAGGTLTSRLDLSVTARNPNQKIVFVYDPSTISVSSDGVNIGEGSFPAFIHGTKNTTVLRTTISTSGEALDASTASSLKKKSSLPLVIDVETKAGVKIGGLKTSKIGIRVSCDGVNVPVPKAKGNVTVASPDASCKVKLRIKIWKWTI